MQALNDTIAALGQPVFARTLGPSARPAAVIARWRHEPATVDVAPSNAIRLAISLVDGRNARNRNGDARADRSQRGHLSIFSPTEGTSVDVNAEADVVQLFVDLPYAEAALDAPFACPPMFDLHDNRMQTAIMRILVGSARHGPDCSLMIDHDLLALALRVRDHANRRQNRAETSLALFRGGLAPAAFRRIEAMIEAGLDEAAAPSLADMAGATGLSVTHFVRAFRRHTGSTPYKYVVGRRMARAVSLLRIARMPVAEVADEVGYATPAHFVASFRTSMGVTPAAFRDALAG